MHRIVLVWSFLVYSSAFLCSSSGVQARKLNTMQRYEKTLVQWALRQVKLQRDPHPEGKQIQKILIVRANVISAFDPWPNLVNIFHIKTRDSIIRRELLVQEGQIWKKQFIAESERNLRRLSILTTAQAIACKAKRSDQVILLIVTKDIWSLRLSTGFNFSGTVLRELAFYPMEMNLAGLAKQLGLIIRIQQLDLSNFSIRDKITLGQFYYDPRLFGTRLSLYQEFNLYLNGAVPCGGQKGQQKDIWCPTQEAGMPNGLKARLQLRRSLFSLSTRWGFVINAQYNSSQVRGYRQNDPQKPIPFGERPGLSIRTVHFKRRDGTVESVPYVYNTRTFIANAGVTYSIGYRTKHNFSASGGLAWYNFSLPSNFAFDDQIRRQFMRFSLPQTESYAYLSFGYSFSSSRFLRLRNVNLFGLSEDFAVGPSFTLGIRPSIDLLNSNQPYVVLSSSIGYSWDLHKNLLYLNASAQTRWQPHSYEIGLAGPWLNSFVSASVYGVTRPLLLGRFFARTSLIIRDNNIDNAVSGLGNNSGLRGYADGQFSGQNKLQINVEYRTFPINLWTLHLGLVAFYDGGALWGGRDPNAPSQQLPFLYRHSVGLGIRALFPQFSKSVIRIDMGVPLGKDRGPFLTWFSITFGQVF